jgi:hypothetical protein
LITSGQQPRPSGQKPIGHGPRPSTPLHHSAVVIVTANISNILDLVLAFILAFGAVGWV